MWWGFVLEFLAVLVVTLYVYSIFTSFKGQPWYVPANVLIGWFFSFAIVFLMPLDVSSSRYNECVAQIKEDLKKHNTTDSSLNSPECEQPWTYLPPFEMGVIWRIIYWTNYVMTWTNYPILQSYVLSGEFTFLRKIGSAIKENVILYAVAGVVGAIFLLWIAIKEGLDQQRLAGIAIAAGNAWGLFLLIAFMGYGLVEVPRLLWLKSNRSDQMKKNRFMTIQYHEEREACKKELMKVFKVVRKLEERLEPADPFYKYLQQIRQNCPNELYSTVLYGDGEIDMHSYKALVKLNYSVVSAVHAYRRSVVLYDRELHKSWKLEDVISTKKNKNRERLRRVPWTTKPPRQHRFAAIVDFAEWVWLVFLVDKFLKIVSILCVLLSIIVVWSEVTFFSENPTLSLFALLIQAPNVGDFALQLFVFVPVTYMAACAYYGLFQLRIFNYIRLIPHQMTDAASLFFSALYLSRLATPLAYNFLFMIHDDHTEFNSVMGDMNIVPVVGKEFNLYFPLILVALCLLTVFNCYQRFLGLFKIKRYRYDSDLDDMQISEGKALIRRERELRLGPGGVLRPSDFHESRAGLLQNDSAAAADLESGKGKMGKSKSSSNNLAAAGKQDQTVGSRIKNFPVMKHIFGRPRDKEDMSDVELREVKGGGADDDLPPVTSLNDRSFSTPSYRSTSSSTGSNHSRTQSSGGPSSTSSGGGRPSMWRG